MINYTECTLYRREIPESNMRQRESTPTTACKYRHSTVYIHTGCTPVICEIGSIITGVHVVAVRLWESSIRCMVKYWSDS